MATKTKDPTDAVNKPDSYKGLMLRKAKKGLPRGLKFAVRSNQATWATSDGDTYFAMPLSEYAQGRAKADGFALALD